MGSRQATGLSPARAGEMPVQVGPSVGVLFHPRVPSSRVLADELARELAARGAEALVMNAWQGDRLADHLGPHARLEAFDWVIVLGGDGTVLRVARMTAPHGVPLVGVNFGRLGFLTDVEARDALEAAARVLAGEAMLEERVLLRCVATIDGRDTEPMDAVNDVFVGRGKAVRPVRLDTRIDGVPFTRYFADGLIVATPTGSTAYSLSAGGPVVAPTMDALVLAPVVPHPIPVGAMVLPGETRIDIDVHTDVDAVLSLDGQRDLDLRDGDRVHLRVGPHRARFLRLAPACAYYESMIEKLRRGKTTPDA